MQVSSSQTICSLKLQIEQHHQISSNVQLTVCNGKTFGWYEINKGFTILVLAKVFGGNDQLMLGGAKAKEKEKGDTVGHMLSMVDAICGDVIQELELVVDDIT